MSLVTLIQKGSLRGLATAAPATIATHEPPRLRTVATVATLAIASALGTTANDPTAIRNRAPGDGDLIPQTGELRPDSAEPDTDRWCYPNSSAMTGREIDTFAARLACLIEMGLDQNESERLSDRLMVLDRDIREKAVNCAATIGYL